MQDFKSEATLPPITRRCVVSGRVQGVFFRQATWKKVLAMGGLTGTVQNLDTGEVEVIISGPPTKVDELSTWLKKGPPLAKVTDLTITEYPPTIFNDFIILK